MKTWLWPRKNGNEGLRLKKDIHTPHTLNSVAVATTGIHAEKHCWKKMEISIVREKFLQIF